MPRWAEALMSEIKKHRDLLMKLEEKQHKNDSRKKASAQQFVSRGCEGSLISVARPLP